MSSNSNNKQNQFNETIGTRSKYHQNKRHSIRLQIELPFIDANEVASYRMRKSSTFNDGFHSIKSDTFDNEESSNADDDTNDFNPTIKLQISFDTRSRAKSTRNYNESTDAHASCLKRRSLVTSDYSSSFCSSNSTKYSYENIYDKLDYNMTGMSQRRKSIAALSKNSFETIGQPSFRARVYENEPIQSNQGSIFKREYTVNEIFQNLESFKADASDIENNSNNISENQVKQSKSISFLKQIRSSLLKKSKSIKLSKLVSSHKLETNKNNNNNNLTKQHTYVNDRIKQ